MANVWVGPNYYITSIHSQTNYTHVFDADANNYSNIASETYLVTCQRYGEIYPSPTEVVLDTYVDSIQSGLSDDDLVSAIIPKIDAALVTDDASDKSDGHSATSTDAFTLKI